MIEGVFAHSQSFVNFPIVYTELDEGQPHDLGVKEGTVRPNLAVFVIFPHRNKLTHFTTSDGWHVWAYPLTHRVPCFGYVFKVLRGSRSSSASRRVACLPLRVIRYLKRERS